MKLFETNWIVEREIKNLKMYYNNCIKIKSIKKNMMVLKLKNGKIILPKNKKAKF